MGTGRLAAGESFGPTGRWMSLAEVERDSGLHRAQVSRFVPPVDTPSGPLFSAHHLAVARFVKHLTKIGARPRPSTSSSAISCCW